MTDREKVIGHFQDAIAASGAENRWRFVRVDMIEDAIALLREQEPVKPIVGEYGARLCGNCGEQVGAISDSSPYIIQIRLKYCPECGRKVKWYD